MQALKLHALENPPAKHIFKAIKTQNPVSTQLLTLPGQPPLWMFSGEPAGEEAPDRRDKNSHEMLWLLLLERFVQRDNPCPWPYLDVGATFTWRNAEERLEWFNGLLGRHTKATKKPLAPLNLAHTLYRAWQPAHGLLQSVLDFPAGAFPHRFNEDSSKATLVDKFHGFHLRTEPEARNWLRTDLDALFDRLQDNTDPLDCLRDLMVLDTHYRLPFAHDPALYKAVRSTRLFRQCLLKIAAPFLNALKKQLERDADPDTICFVLRFLLALAFHTEPGFQAPNPILKALGQVLMETPTLKRIQENIQAYLHGLHKAEVLICQSSPAAQLGDVTLAWAPLGERIKDLVQTNKRLWKVKSSPETPALAGTLASRKPTEDLGSSPDAPPENDTTIVQMVSAVEYSFVFLDGLKMVVQSETHNYRKVNEGRSAKTLTFSWNKKQTGSEDLVPTRLYFPSHPGLPAVEGRFWSEDTRDKVTFDYPGGGFQALETFSTLYVRKTLYHAHSTLVSPDWATVGSIPQTPVLKDHWTWGWLVSARKYHSMVYRSIFPTWYPLQLLTIQDGGLVVGEGAVAYLSKKHRGKEVNPQEKPYFSTPEHLKYLDEHTHFSLIRLPDKLILEYVVAADHTGFVPEGWYGYAFQRPALNELMRAFSQQMHQHLRGALK